MTERDTTDFDGEEKRVLRRRPIPQITISGGKKITNRNVVPYSPVLLKLMDSHINVEPFTEGRGVNYLHKYLVKGATHETVAFSVEIPEGKRTVNFDEIHYFVSARYLSDSEAYWHLMSFPMHFSSHIVLSLPIHMSGGQSVVFSEGQEEAALIRQARKKSQMQAFFDLNHQEKVANADLK